MNLYGSRFEIADAAAIVVRIAIIETCNHGRSHEIGGSAHFLK